MDVNVNPQPGQILSVTMHYLIPMEQEHSPTSGHAANSLRLNTTANTACPDSGAKISERSVLSCMLQDPEHRIDQAIAKGLTAGHLHLPAYGVLFDAPCDLYGTGAKIELAPFIQ